MVDLSVIIPARNEIFLSKTIDDILSNIEGNTEIIAVLDGSWAEPPIKDDPRVILIHHSQSIGQRAACNEAARVSQAKFILKCDAHCSFDRGFDVKMIREMHDDWTLVPIMRNLHAFDWVCPDGHRRYQSPSGVCKECGKETKMEIMWIAKNNPQSTSYCFDAEPHFQYFQDYKNRPEYKEGLKNGLTETMSLQGSCWMVTREKYFELNLCDENFGSWGSQGLEVAIRSWTSGGKVMVNHKTWYAHMFRTQGGDFGFPYPLSGRQVENAKKMARDLFFENKWEKQVKPLSWLVEHFFPVPGWNEEKLAEIKKFDFPSIIKSPSKGCIYYTDNQCDELIMSACQKQLLSCCNGYPIISVSLKPIDFGQNIVFNGERGKITYYKQILTALENCKTDIVFFCEHDILYNPSHFDFTPTRKDIFYYNDNKWKICAETGKALFYHCAQVSGLCGWRDLLLGYYRWRVDKIEKEGYKHIGYEPGTHSKQFEMWNSEFPNIDLRHKNTMSANRWSQDEFRDKNTCLGWKLITPDEEIPYWGTGKKVLEKILSEK